MAVSLLPLRNDTAVYSFITTLTGVDFGFRFYWNDQDAAWYFDLSDATGVPLLDGVRVVLGTLALRSSTALPFGYLICVDQSNTHTEPGLTDLGARVIIGYLE